MSKVAVVFWSGTGNTQAMAEAVAEGARTKGAEVTVLGPSEFGADQVALYDAIACGSPRGRGIRADVRFGRRRIARQEDCPLWLLGLGRRCLDERLGGEMQ